MPSEVQTPWTWRWSWNGPNSSGGVASGHIGLPRNSQPVTGGGRVYIAAGASGIYALNQTTGTVVWNYRQATFNSTPAYDGGAVFAYGANGTLYKLDASTGATLATFAAGSGRTIALPPAVTSDRVLFASGSSVYAVAKSDLSAIWQYAAGANVEQPPAYSAAYDVVVVVTSDLYVHCILNSTGARNWRVKPTTRSGGDPGGSNTSLANAAYGSPVIADVHGLVLVKYQLDWNTLWTWSPWPTSNTTIRSNLTSNPGQQALFALHLSNGAVPFIVNVGHGGYGNGSLPMGPQPVVKTFADGTEVLYTVIRGDSRFDGRWDSHFGEIVLDGTTIAGLQAGHVRWIQWGNYGWGDGSVEVITDEQPFVSMAGSQLFGAHWLEGYALRITDRSAARGTYSAPILSSKLQSLVGVTTPANCSNSFSSSHVCSTAIAGATTEGEWRKMPAPGFYVYWNVGKVYDTYWSSYAAWVPSGNMLFFVTTDGALVALGW